MIQPSYDKLSDIMATVQDGMDAIIDAVNEIPASYGLPQGKPAKAKYKSIQAKRFHDDYDAIYEAYINPKKKLSQTQLKQLARWKFARTWMSDFDPPTDYETAMAIRTQFGVSVRQAYADIANCKRLFCSVDKVNEEFDKIMAVERIMRLRNKALARGDAKSLDVAAKCDLTLIKLKGWDREKSLMPQPTLVEVVVTTDLSVLGLEPVENKALAIQSFWKKKEDTRKREIQDIDFDDLIENPRNERELAR